MKRNTRRLLAFALSCTLLISSSVMLSTRTAQAKDPVTADDTEKVVDAYITVMTMAYPPAGGALAAAKGVMGMFGFWNKPDAVGEAITAINERLNAIDSRMDTLEQNLQATRNATFRNANLQNTRNLRDKRDAIEDILLGLKNKPTDKYTKEKLVLDARQVCDALREDRDLWIWSDLVIKEHNWNGQTIRKGVMLDPDFKAMPTLEVYASAIATWMAAIEYAGGGDKAYVKRTFTRDLQKHIDFLTTRPGWNEFADAPQTLPEEIQSRVAGFYVPTSRRPDATQTCVIAEYSRDDMAREIKLVGNLSYVARSANEMCSVPARLLNVSTPREQELETAYGLDVIDTLAKKLTQLRDKGTLREQFIGTFNPVTAGGETLYGITPDGAVMWFSDNIQTRPVGAEKTILTEHITHNLSSPVDLGRNFSNSIDVLPGGAETIYVERGNGDLDWYRHDGYLNGKPTWQGPTTVGTGWNNGKIIAMGSGVLYTLSCPTARCAGTSTTISKPDRGFMGVGRNRPKT